jgi:DNA topoisomerase-1
MELMIVESPKKAKTIKKFLGKNFIILASYGHILDLPKKKFGLYLKNNKLQYQYQPINWKFIKKLKLLLNNDIKNIYLATDPDREGEFIAWSISYYLKNRNFYRLRFYEITRQAILKALKNKGKLNYHLIAAQKSRRFLDRIVGYTLSPLLWKNKIGQSAGRVQSAALRLIVDREKERENFQAQNYYSLEINFGSFKAYLVNKNHSYYFSEEQLSSLQNLKSKLEKENFKINKIIKEEKIVKKPTPIDTALLQRISFKKYGFSPSLTMKLAQSLYEKGLITYHRTDSFYLSSDFLNKIKNYLKADYKEPRRLKIKFSQEAHEAVRPVYLSKNFHLTADEQKLYHLIFDYTLAACSFSAVLEKKYYLLTPFNFNNLIFETVGEKIIKRGFLKFYPLPFSVKFDPELFKGQVLTPQKITISKKQTLPPSRYNEATLIKKLKELKIGRPSTYAEILKILFKRQYIKKEKQSLLPTEKGIQVIDFLKKHYPSIVDLNFTSQMEINLDKIAQGQLDYQKFIIDFWKKLKNNL